MSVGIALLLFAVAGSFFGCGILCGYFLFKNQQFISLNVSDRMANLAKPIGDLQSTVRQIEIGLQHHGQRLSADIGALDVPSFPAAQATILQGFIEANRGFEVQVKDWANRVRRTSELIGHSLEPTPSTGVEDRDGNSTAKTSKSKRELNRAEQRNEKRHPFFCQQWIAPYNGYRAPDPEEFLRVQCRDISSSGIAFFVDRVPYYELVVIRLPGDGAPKYLTARIQRVKPSANCEYGAFTVGCMFLGSLHASAFAPHLEGSIQRREKQLEVAACMA